MIQIEFENPFDDKVDVERLERYFQVSALRQTWSSTDEEARLKSEFVKGLSEDDGKWLEFEVIGLQQARIMRSISSECAELFRFCEDDREERAMGRALTGGFHVSRTWGADLDGKYAIEFGFSGPDAKAAISTLIEHFKHVLERYCDYHGYVIRFTIIENVEYFEGREPLTEDQVADNWEVTNRNDGMAMRLTQRMRRDRLGVDEETRRED